VPEIIKLKSGDQNLSINQTGAGIMEYYLESPVGRQDIIYGYSKIEDKVGSMGDVLFPFPGRVENSQYEFNGQKYQLSGVKIKDGHAIHGFVKDKEWKIIHKSDSAVTLSFQIEESEFAKFGFPFSLLITIKYQLSDNGLICQSEVKNTGGGPAPFGLGFHPYYTVETEKIDDMRVEIKANKLVEFDKGLKPTGKLLEVKNSKINFIKSNKIGSEIIDNCFSELIYTKGVHRTVLTGNSGRKVVIWQDKSFPYLQVYSADTIGNLHKRRGFAVEPQTCTGFAFNVPDMGLNILESGEVFKGNWGIDNK